MRPVRLALRAIASLAIVISLSVPSVAGAQEVVGGTEEIDFDRPEAWALKWFASVTVFTGVGAPRHRSPGEVELGLELGWIPTLSEEERRVGFNGTKVEDLNRVPVLPRPRIAVGLPGDLTLDVAWIPPIEVDGVTPNILSLALERPLLDRGRFMLGLRAIGQIGGTEGDYTCSAHDASFPPGSADNPFGCEEPSSDESTLEYLGLGVTGGFRLAGSSGATLHFAAFATSMDLELQVDAVTYGVRDRTRLVTDGWTWLVAAGGELPLGKSTSISAELAYSPLDVRRDPLSTATENDALFNVRAMVRHVIR